jgi:hypothetical protein
LVRAAVPELRTLFPGDKDGIELAADRDYGAIATVVASRLVSERP